MRGWPWLLVGGLLAGCAAWQPRPIDPGRVEQGFRGRTLADPGLQGWLARHRPPASEPAPPDTLDLPGLTLIALYYHPDLDVARAQLAVAEASIVTAGGRPNPSVGIGPGYNVDTGGSPWTFGLDVDIPIETAGKRGYRIMRAERLSQAARLELAEVAWRVRSRVRAALVEHLFAGEDVDLFDAEERTRRELVTVFERRLAVGDVDRIVLERTRTDLATTRLARRAALVRVADSRAALASALGLPATALAGVRVAWPDRTRLPSADALAPALVQRHGLLNRLDVRRALAEYDAAEAALRLEIARQYPDVRLGPGYTWDEGDNKFGIGLSVTLPVLNRNEGPIAEAEARRREVAARFLATQADVIGESDKALTRYQAVLAEAAEAEAAVAALDVREDATRRALEVGEADRPTLLAVQVEHAVATRLRLAALRKAQEALGTLEDAVQRPLDASSPFPEADPASPRDAPEATRR